MAENRVELKSKTKGPFVAVPFVVFPSNHSDTGVRYNIFVIIMGHRPWFENGVAHDAGQSRRPEANNSLDTGKLELGPNKHKS